MIEIQLLSSVLNAVVAVPPSKSFTHRALIASALAEGESVLSDALRSEDTIQTASGLEKLGVPVTWEAGSFRVQGTGGNLLEKEQKIYVHHSGTSMRFLTAMASLKRGRTLIDGSERMRQRPISELLSGLTSLGVTACSLKEKGFPPVRVDSQGLLGGVAKIRGDESSQFLSALLLVAPYAQKDVRIEMVGPVASWPYVEMTLEVMAAFGVQILKRGDQAFFIKAGQRYRPRIYSVEGDASSASYFFAAAAITRGKVRVENYSPNSTQGDSAILNILEQMGCKVRRGEDFAEVQGAKLRGIDIDMNTMPDLVPTLAVTAAFASGETVMRHIGHLRLKESDRIATVALELEKMGVRVEEGEDWLRVNGGTVRGAEIESHNDHRLAMSFAVAGLAVPGMRIQGERCVEKSFPEFWRTLYRLYEKK